jgi:hypothetical protein
MKIWQPYLNVPNFQIPRDEIPDNKPIIFSENALKLTYGNAEFQNFPGEDPVPPAPRGGKGREEEWKKEEGWEGGKGVRRGREGLKERERKEREETGEGKQRRI